MPTQTLLVVEDDPKIRTLLRNVMEDEGFCVEEASTADEALRKIDSGTISLVTLDLYLGTENGLDLARKIRQKSQLPIVMITGKDDVIDRVVGLELGADDYITKPFHIKEVVARIKSVLRRSQDTREVAKGDAMPQIPLDSPSSNRLTFDGMTAVPDRFELLDRDGADCGLTSGDFKLMSVFLQRPKKVLSRDQLMDLVGGPSWSPLDRTIDNQVARLRKKIERNPSDPKLIKTVRGVGYTFACDVDVVQSTDVSSKSA
ncbi:response regulator [Sulfitobacter sp. JB4-11]|uniref:response regulator n=1 Tax=Sulfitobacter rhodophyticola TaxID=3238304 RepID=UPI0035132112